MAANSLLTVIQDVVTEFMPELEKQAKAELQEQGHALTGSLEESMETTVYSDGDTTVGEISFNDYGNILDKGVTPERIPFRGSGTHSAYIEGLKTFWSLRGLSEKEATKAAFATAQKHSQEGMPTANAYAYSSNSRRTDWKEQALIRSDWKNRIPQKIDSVLDSLIQKVIDGYS